MRRFALTFAFALAALGPAPARAIDVNDGQLTIHGDGWWSYERTGNANAYGSATKAGNYENAMFDLVLRARPTDDLVLAAQLGWDPGETSVEFVFAELRLTDELKLRIGKMPQPIGNLNELRFAGTTRAFFYLPASVYGPTSVVGTTFEGAGLAWQHYAQDGWSYGADLYGGSVAMTELEGYRAVPAAGLGAGLDVPPVAMEQQVRDAVGGRFWVTTPNELTLRLSAFGGSLSDDEAANQPFRSVGLSVHRRGERLWLGAELFFTTEVGTERQWAGYAFAAWRFSPTFQASLRYERVQTLLDGYHGSSPLLRHQGVGLTLGYQYDPNLVFKAEVELIEGNRLAFPADTTSTDLAGTTLPRRTSVFTFGTQFTF